MAAFGRFVGPPSLEDLERCFRLDDADRKLVAKRRGDADRLRFALLLTTVRYLGTSWMIRWMRRRWCWMTLPASWG
jgi:Domain of unknown function (DUF4158)